jgi:phosphoglycerate dehydrogenase-like enzyme
MTNMKLIVVINHRVQIWEAPAWFDQKLRQEFPQWEIIRFSTNTGNPEEFKDADVIFSSSLTPEQFGSANHLQWIHSPSAAIHQFLFPELVRSHVTLTNGRYVHGLVVAEHVIALIFALAKNLPRSMRLQTQHAWGQAEMAPEGFRPREIAGATLGLVGLGSIGANVAKHAAALGMRVIATRENPAKPKPEGAEQVFPASELSRLLRESDYVVLTVPVTASTEKLINEQRLKEMNRQACLINVGRGTLIDEVALAQALKNKTIAFAALDVFEKEPLPESSPLWDLENALITPHIAGFSDKVWERQYAFFTENLRRFIDRQPLSAIVDKQKGY